MTPAPTPEAAASGAPTPPPSKKPAPTLDSKGPQRYKALVTWILFIGVLYVCFVGVDADFLALFSEGARENMGRILGEMLRPDWSYASHIWKPMVETVQIAIAGTIIGAVLAVPVALLCAVNIMPKKIVSIPARMVLNLVRTVPDLLFAAIFVAVFGIGAFAGMLALVFFSFGLVAKLTYEAIEAIDPGPLEAMTASGANKIQLIVFGVIPQALPYFFSYVLYTFEVNVRAAAVLGFVGAGGIGLHLDQQLNSLRYDRASTIILLTLVIVLLIDYASTYLRRKLL
ncbi:phosphonate ABC transporter, permease protein PhnE [Saccharibacillus endophyticus]|uniref:Phosphonate ABC transporter permease n=1 Tax=Saccharibacillus endophyticus TaxID=2060666 RepID=A0ABQ1ZSE9_9BACL|nr:phosphonate ABC transporter, permease protein PhnE [Saccharibacillus endophyticus]GGH75386.1 phosphonate ABC transporter permease [Saccharibacillus endophyticus]